MEDSEAQSSRGQDSLSDGQDKACRSGPESCLGPVRTETYWSPCLSLIPPRVLKDRSLSLYSSLYPSSWAQLVQHSKVYLWKEWKSLSWHANMRLAFVPFQAPVPKLDVVPGVCKNIWSKFQQEWTLVLNVHFFLVLSTGKDTPASPFSLPAPQGLCLQAGVFPDDTAFSLRHQIKQIHGAEVSFITKMAFQYSTFCASVKRNGLHQCFPKTVSF